MRRPGEQGVRPSGRRPCGSAIGALALAFALLACTSVARADWIALGDTVNPGPSFYLGERPDVADVEGTPYVAWRETTPEFDRQDIRVSRWTGSAWQVVGQPLNAMPFVSHASIASVDGVPYVAFIEVPAAPDGLGQLRVSRLNGTGDGWVAVDGGALNHDPVNGDAKQFSIATIGSIPHVAFTEVDASQTILWVKKLQGSSWVTVGSQLNVYPVAALYPNIAGVGGAPCVAWLSADSRSVGGDPSLRGLRVSRFSGTSWVGLGDKVRDGLSSVGHLTDVGGVPTILFTTREETYVVQQWDGTSWGDLGDPFNDPDDPLVEDAFDSGSITTIDGTPYVAIPSAPNSGSPRIRVLRYDATAWTQVGSDLHRSVAAYPGEPVISSVGGNAIVAWGEEAGGGEKIHASQFDVTSYPETTITGDSTATRAGVGSYAFTADPPDDATFECSWDDEPFKPCTSPHQSGVLDPGNHNFRVRASNASGTDPTPASRDFIVDRVAPTTTIRLDGGRTPQGAFAGSVTVEADVTDPPLSSGIAGKFCVVDPPTPPTSLGAFGSQPCGVVVTAIGTHTAYAIANDNARNESSIVSATFVIAAAPDTIITEGPSGLVSSLPVRWAYRTTIPGSTFECQLDSAPFRACDATRTYLDLPDGPHTFSVRAVGPSGVVDPTPATRSITVGPTQISGSCSGTFPFGDPFSLSGKFSTGGVTCVALDEPCPAGSSCSLTQTVGVTDADTRTPWYSQGSIDANGPGVKSILRTLHCYSTPEEEYDINKNLYPNDPLQPACPQTATRFAVLGPARLLAQCEVSRSIYGSGFHVRGPDDQRRHTCAATIEIRPRHILSVTVAGTSGATTVPGAGQLTITGALIGAQSARALRAATDPATAFKVKKRVKAEGVVRFRLGLQGEAKRLYKAGGVIELELTTTFVAADGTITTTQEVVTLQAPEKPRRKLRAKGPRNCTIFAGECP